MRSMTKILGSLAVAALATAGAARPQEQAGGPSGPMDLFIAFSRMQLAGAGFERREATVGGHRTVWWEGGSGPTLVMVHGVADQAGTITSVGPEPASHQTVRWPPTVASRRSKPAAASCDRLKAMKRSIGPACSPACSCGRAAPAVASTATASEPRICLIEIIADPIDSIQNRRLVKRLASAAPARGATRWRQRTRLLN